VERYSIGQKSIESTRNLLWTCGK